MFVLSAFKEVLDQSLTLIVVLLLSLPGIGVVYFTAQAPIPGLITLGYILQLKSVFINTDLNNQFSSFDQLVVQKLLL